MTKERLIEILNSHVDTYGCDRMHINVIHPDSIPEIADSIIAELSVTDTEIDDGLDYNEVYDCGFGAGAKWMRDRLTNP